MTQSQLNALLAIVPPEVIRQSLEIYDDRHSLVLQILRTMKVTLHTEKNELCRRELYAHVELDDSLMVLNKIKEMKIVDWLDTGFLDFDLID